ncbi:MAG: hypothetical protein AB7N71_09550, partial [Phycisphaerae bacterium]
IRARRGHYAFGTMVITMWVMWLWTWPTVFPILVSQAGFRDFAAQLQQALPRDEAEKLAAQRRLVQVAHQDPRIIWYSDYRFPRIVDEFEILKEQEGVRDKAYEWRRVGEEILELLRSDKPAYIVIGIQEYVQFIAVAEALAREYALELPEIHLWIKPNYGRPDRNALMISNVPRPEGDLPPIELKEEARARLVREARKILGPQYEALAKSLADDKQPDEIADIAEPPAAFNDKSSTSGSDESAPVHDPASQPSTSAPASDTPAKPEPPENANDNATSRGVG